MSGGAAFELLVLGEEAGSFICFSDVAIAIPILLCLGRNDLIFPREAAIVETLS